MLKLYNVEFDSHALRDLQEAQNYYDTIDYSLGEKFLASIKLAVFNLEQFPTNFSYINEDDSKRFRKIILKKFPYSLIYEIKNKNIIVLSVHHFARNPDKKLRKK